MQCSNAISACFKATSACSARSKLIPGHARTIASMHACRCAHAPPPPPHPPHPHPPCPPQVGRQLYVEAGSLGVPVGIMAFKGLLLHIDDIRTLCSQHPGTACIIDHCGFANVDDLESGEWRALLALAQFPQVCVGKVEGVWEGKGWGWVG
jgi:hypothetical protein